VAASQINGVVQTGDNASIHIHADQVPFRMVPPVLDQLPAAELSFTGRDHELALLAEALDPAAADGAALVSAVAGIPGVGKTALAVQAGHAARRRDCYPGGVLFIDLHGYDDQPIQPGQALDALLRALRVPPDDIPPSTDERATLYRSALARVGEPMLVFADNASSEAQVRPLLPGAGPHRVLLTSRACPPGSSRSPALTPPPPLRCWTPLCVLPGPAMTGLPLTRSGPICSPGRAPDFRWLCRSARQS
jgi:hypothetical protein